MDKPKSEQWRCSEAEKIPKSKKIRVFIAISLPEHVIHWISGIQESLQTDRLPVQWTRSGSIHLTLKFLGEISPETATDVCRMVAETVEPASWFEIFAQGVGVFPGIRRPRVLWTGVGGRIDLLSDLQRRIDDAVHLLGFAKEERTFTGHLTIGRFKEGRGSVRTGAAPLAEALIEIMKRFHRTASAPFVVDAVCVFKSELKSSGPVYTFLATAPLAGT